MTIHHSVIPGRGPMPANPESTNAFGLLGFRVRRFATPRNDRKAEALR
jgi:hypothetical protein